MTRPRFGRLTVAVAVYVVGVLILAVLAQATPG
jgi:hypothetical protein